MAKTSFFTVLPDYEIDSAPVYDTASVTSYIQSKPTAEKPIQSRTHYIIEINDFSPEKKKVEKKGNSGSEHTHRDYSVENFPVMHFVYHEFSRQNCRESLWKRAVENLYRRINFLELNIDFLNEYINGDEFEEALTTREDEFVISFHDVKDTLEAEAIYDIVRALGKSFDVHEVAELFGVEAKSLYAIQVESNQQPSKLLGLGSWFISFACCAGLRGSGHQLAQDYTSGLTTTPRCGSMRSV